MGRVAKEYAADRAGGMITALEGTVPAIHFKVTFYAKIPLTFFAEAVVARLAGEVAASEPTVVTLTAIILTRRADVMFVGLTVTVTAGALGVVLVLGLAEIRAAVFTAFVVTRLAGIVAAPK